MILLWLLACRTATVVDGCDLGEETCPVCDSDEECGYGGNACTETVYCAHEDAEISVIQIGCSEALEYQWPAEETCRCVAERCTAAE